MGFETFSGFFGGNKATQQKEEEGRMNETPNTGERGGLDTKNKANEYKDVVDEELADKELLDLFEDKAVKKIRTDIEGEEAPVMYDHSPESIPDEEALEKIEAIDFPDGKMAEHLNIYRNPAKEKTTFEGWGQKPPKTTEEFNSTEEVEPSYRKAV